MYSLCCVLVKWSARDYKERMSPVLEPEPEREAKPSDSATTTFRAKKTMIEEIDAVAKPLKLSRNKAIVQLLRYALDAHKKDAKKKG